MRQINEWNSIFSVVNQGYYIYIFISISIYLSIYLYLYLYMYIHICTKYGKILRVYYYSLNQLKFSLQWEYSVNLFQNSKVFQKVLILMAVHVSSHVNIFCGEWLFMVIISLLPFSFCQPKVYFLWLWSNDRTVINCIHNLTFLVRGIFSFYSTIT